jgi:hypothetical protein
MIDFIWVAEQDAAINNEMYNFGVNGNTLRRKRYWFESSKLNVLSNWLKRKEQY